ncbi:hypothetical protein [Candidatus Palauibacter sp.]|uniref:hypothetical protein n=1 Tax=Candidatus Palauibacter sp. TaxID=3101350 RepID=UPI003B51E93A
MKIVIASLMMLGAAGVSFPALAGGGGDSAPRLQEEQDIGRSMDAEELYDIVKQARAQLRETRVLAGLGAHASGPQVGRLESREGREGRTEYGNRERGEGGEEGGAYLGRMTRQDELFANGARLILQFNPNTQVFVGSVTNTTTRTLSQVRVEIHLDNGTELGPTKRINVGPGQTIPVELGTFGNDFSSWVSHPEAGVEQGHGGGEESGEGRGGREGRGEHGGREGGAEHGGEASGEHGGQAGGEVGGEEARPRDAAYRPLYNQLQVLRGEMRAFEVELRARSR